MDVLDWEDANLPVPPLDERAIGSMNQPLDSNPTDFPDDTVADDLPDPEADPTYFPPTDPVMTVDAKGDEAILGGFASTSDDDVSVDASTLDGIPGDEALRDAIRSALRLDATTTALKIRVQVRDGVAHLHGTVNDLADVENAEAVAANVPGVREVIEELEIA